MNRRSDALQGLARAAEERDQAEDGVELAVHSARHVGASWAEVGAALGVSRQAAQQRYGDRP